MRRPTRGGVALALLAAVPAALAPAAAFAAGSASTGSANVPWYLTRAFGMAAYLLLFVTVALGISIRTKGLDRLLARWRVNDLHTFLALLAALFVVVHVAALLADAFVGFSVVEVLVPFASPYVPVWTGLGIITTYVMALVLVSFPLRRYMGYRVWRTLHYLTFAVYLGALMHGLFTGSDSRVVWAQAIYLGTATAVVALVVARMTRWGRRELAVLDTAPERVIQSQPSLARAGVPVRVPPPHVQIAERRDAVFARAAGYSFGAIAIAFLIFAAAALGPFRWFGHNAQPTQSAQAAQSSGVGSGTAPVAANPLNLDEGYSGTMTDQSLGDTRTLTLHLAASGAQPVSLDLQLQVQRTGDGQAVTENSATLAGPNGAPVCSGQVTAFDQTGFQAICQGSGADAGQAWAVAGTFDTGLAAQVQGTLSVRPAASSS